MFYCLQITSFTFTTSNFWSALEGGGKGEKRDVVIMNVFG